MSYGIEVNNANGNRIIGADTSVPRFVGKYTKTSWSINNKSGHRLRWSITCPSVPMCFLHVALNRGAKISLISGTAPNWTVEVLCAYSASMSPSDVTLYVFSAGYTTKSSDWGMRVMKSNGEVAFDTGFKQLVLKGGTWVPRNTVYTRSDIEGTLSKPAVMVNAYGSGYYSLFYAADFLYFFGSWFPTSFDLNYYLWEDCILRSSTNWGILPTTVNDVASTANQPSYTPSSQGTVTLSNYTDYTGPAIYTWGIHGTDGVSYTSPCQGDPNCQVASCLPANFTYNFFPGGIYTGVTPASGNYAVLMIDGADYD